MIFRKQIDDEAESAWTQDLLSRIEEDGYRVARPLRMANGDWVENGWIASEFIDGLRPAAPDWDTVIRAGLRFGVAAEQVRAGDVPHRTHRWAVADRAAWHEEDVTLDAATEEARHRIVSTLVRTPSPERHFVHGDLTGNVFVDPDGVPVVLDISPYLRPRRWGEAIVVADAVMWFGADQGLARAFAAEEPDLLGRALVFRLVAEAIADAPAHGADLAPYRLLLDGL